MGKQALSITPQEEEVAKVSVSLNGLSRDQFEKQYLQKWLILKESTVESPQWEILWAIVITFENHPQFDVKRIRQLRGKK